MYWIVLICGAFVTLVYVVLKIRSHQIATSDAVFWFIFVLCLLLLAIAPGIAFFFSDALGIMSPANFVFLCIAAVLVYRELLMTVKVARLQSKLSLLTQTVALQSAVNSNDDERRTSEQDEK